MEAIMIPSRRMLLAGAASLGGTLLASCGPKSQTTTPSPKGDTGAGSSDPRAIVRDAWIYAYPMIMNYATLAKQTLDSANPGYVGGFGKFRHYAQFFTPANRDIVTPNNDTPYSWAWLDLRAEPWVLTVPAAQSGRYYVHQWMDLFTQIFGYVGVRATGEGPGSYLIAGPKWSGPAPAGIAKVLKAESDIVVDLGRTSLLGPSDIDALKAFQAQYKLQPLSAFAKTAAPVAAPAIAWPAWDEKKWLGPEFIGLLNFLLQFTQPPAASETGLMARFARVGIGPGKPFDLASLSESDRAAVIGGAQDGQAALKAKIAVTNSSIGLFGSREQLGDDYLKRAAAAAMGIYGNAAEEAVYVGAAQDSTGQPLDGAGRYEIHLTKDQLPPAKYFWSATLYELPSRLLSENSIHRYSLGDRSPGLKFGDDGSLTLYVQREPPAADKQGNWLPAPKTGPFTVIFRLYGPSPAAQTGGWPPPAVRKMT
jgi:hypothetical protein